jgi:hypothetical protein
MRSRQFLAYRFEPGARFEGQLVGALERVESGGAIRVLEILFVTREPETGELTAISLRGLGPRTGELLGFRLDAAERRAATQRALEGADAETVQELAGLLEPGAAIAAVLVEHVWANAVGEAVTRVGGAEAAAEFVDATALGELTERLLTVARA